MSATRPRPKIDTPSGPPGTGKGVAKFKRHVSDEGRQRLSEIATERHRNGGFRPVPGRPKRKRPNKKRVAQKVAEAAREKKNAQAIIDVFKDGVAPHQPINIRIKAAEAWLKVEGDDAKIALKEADFESQKHDRDELLDMLSQQLTAGHAGLLLRKQLESETSDDTVIEGHLVGDVITPNRRDT